MEAAEDVVCVTLDVDWAPDAVLQSVVGTLERYGVPATFFATHESETLQGLDRDQFEIGLHPNFNDAGGDFRTPLASLVELYPEAMGARSHSLFISSRILEHYIDLGLSYEANTFLWRHPHLQPVMRFPSLLSIPFNWSDDKLLELQLGWRLDEVPLGAPGLRVLNFHPIHVFMNTRHTAHYAEYKPHYQDPEALEAFVNRDAPGPGTLFEEVLGELASGGYRLATHAQLCEGWSAGR